MDAVQVWSPNHTKDMESTELAAIYKMKTGNLNSATLTSITITILATDAKMSADSYQWPLTQKYNNQDCKCLLWNGCQGSNDKSRHYTTAVLS